MHDLRAEPGRGVLVDLLGGFARLRARTRAGKGGLLMTVKEFASVFSRYFVVGFYLPAFAGLVALWQTVSTQDVVPEAFRSASTGTKALILGGVALMVALLLSGLHHPIVRLLEGYPIRRGHGSLSHRLDEWTTARWRREFDRLTALLDGPKGPDRTRAARDLDTLFPADRALLLPTRCGNAIRSFETHPRRRYGFDGVAAWPRIDLLLSDGERGEVTEAQGDFAFFVNALVATVMVGVLLAIDRLWHRPGDVGDWSLALVVVAAVSAVASAALYRAAVGAAVRWGVPIRAAFDLHRLELYARVGLKRPADVEEELKVGRAISRLFAFGEPPPDELRASDPPMATQG
jgi:hypothetical protein